MQPGNVYSWNVDDVDVPLQGTVQYTPVPRPLVKQMLLHFQVTGMEEAKVLNGKLNGVYPSVLLLSGEPSEQSISAAPRNEYVVYRDADTGGNQKYGTRLYGFGRDTPAGTAFS